MCTETWFRYKQTGRERERQNPEVGKTKAKSFSLPYFCYTLQNRAHQTLINNSQSAQKHEQTF
jgi:hypothetical protein